MLVCLSFDFDGPGTWITRPEMQDLTAVSRGEFGAVAVPRILALLRRREVPATFFIPGHTALLYPDLVRTIVEEGHEVGHHGWAHEVPTEHSGGEQIAQFDRALHALTLIAGQKPVGYRAPAWQLTAALASRLVEEEFEYDSSCMGSDYEPYYLRVGDEWNRDSQSTIGIPSDVLELPVHWDLDDAPLLEFMPGVSLRGMTIRDIEELWIDEFEFAEQNHAEGVFTLTLHPHVIGRGARLGLLERLLDHIDQRSVEKVTMRIAASRFRSQRTGAVVRQFDTLTDELPATMELAREPWFKSAARDATE